MTSDPGAGTPAAEDILDTPAAGGRAIRGSAIRGVGYAAGTLITLVSAPLLVRHLGVVEFGRYMTAISLAAVVAGVTDVGLASITLREYAVRRERERDVFMRNVLGTRVLLTVAGVLLATAFAVGAGYPGPIVVGTAVAGAGVVLAVVGHTIGVPLAAELRYGWLTILDVAAKAVGVGLVVALVVASAGIVPLLAVPAATGLAVVAVTAVLVRGRVPFRPSLELGELRPLLRDTLPLALATVLTTIYARIVIILLSLIAAETVTGYFATASRVLEVAVGVPLALVSTMLPLLARAARDDAARFRHALQRLLDVALIGGVWMALAMGIAAGLVVEVLGGADARPAAVPLEILSAALIPVFVNVTVQHALLALQHHRRLLQANAVGLIAIVPATLLLVPALDARGAAIAVVVSETTLTVASLIGLLRERPDLRPALFIPLRVLGAGVLALLSTFVPIPWDVAQAVFASLVYFGALAALDALPRELWHAIVTSRGGGPPEPAPAAPAGPVGESSRPAL